MSQNLKLNFSLNIVIDSDAIGIQQSKIAVAQEILNFGNSLYLSAFEHCLPGYSIEPRRQSDELKNTLSLLDFGRWESDVELEFYRIDLHYAKGEKLNYPSNESLFIVISLTSVEFSEGSLIAKVNVVVSMAVAILACVFSGMATPQGQNWYNQKKHAELAEELSRNSECIKLSEWHIESDSLKRLELEMLNFARPGIDLFERHKRICYVQLALSLAQGTPHKISGQLDLKTKSALEYYAKQRGLRPDIANDQLRSHLLEEIQKKRK